MGSLNKRVDESPLKNRKDAWRSQRKDANYPPFHSPVFKNDGGDESNTWTHTIMGRSGLVNWLVWTLTADAVSWAYLKFVNLDQFAEPKFTYGGLNFFIFSDLSHLVE